MGSRKRQGGKKGSSSGNGKRTVHPPPLPADVKADVQTVELAVHSLPSQIPPLSVAEGDKMVDGKETMGKQTTLFHLSAPPVFSPCMIINDRVSKDKQDMQLNVVNQQHHHPLEPISPDPSSPSRMDTSPLSRREDCTFPITHPTISDAMTRRLPLYRDQDQDPPTPVTCRVELADITSTSTNSSTSAPSDEEDESSAILLHLSSVATVTFGSGPRRQPFEDLLESVAAEADRMKCEDDLVEADNEMQEDEEEEQSSSSSDDAVARFNPFQRPPRTRATQSFSFPFPTLLSDDQDNRIDPSIIQEDSGMNFFHYCRQRQFLSKTNDSSCDPTTESIICESTSTSVEQRLNRCDDCGKVYKSPNCLAKHRWEHTQWWSETNRMSLTKHQRVLLLEGASILCKLQSASIADDEVVALKKIGIQNGLSPVSDDHPHRGDGLSSMMDCGVDVDTVLANSSLSASTSKVSLARGSLVRRGALGRRRAHTTTSVPLPFSRPRAGSRSRR